MKTTQSIFLFFIFILSSCNSNKTDSFQGKSQSIYTNEPYVGEVTITYTKNKISDVKFTIKDTLKNQLFDSQYENNFKEPEYKIQCRADLKGVESYPKQLLEKQNLDEVDGMTGATWSYNLFKDAAKEAMKKRQ